MQKKHNTMDWWHRPERSGGPRTRASVRGACRHFLFDSHTAQLKDTHDHGEMQNDPKERQNEYKETCPYRRGGGAIYLSVPWGPFSHYLSTHYTE